MGDSGILEWSRGAKVYSEEQILNVLVAIGIEVKEETPNDFLSFCPYHGNRDTPAFSTSKVHGASVCFNPSCGAAVSLERLVQDLKKTNVFQTRRLIHQAKTDISYSDAFAKATKTEEVEFKEWPQERLDRAYERFWNYQPAQDYMMNKRHFTEATLRDFYIGYGPEIKADPARGIKWKPESILVPAHSPDGMPLGYIGRSLHDKHFNNSYKLPKTEFIWNLHNAKKYETLILTEASFDAMRIHQAGYPNVGALLGGSLSQTQIALIKRYFTKVIIFTDDDEWLTYVRCAKCRRAGHKHCQGHKPGRDLGLSISDALPRLNVSWAMYDQFNVFPPEPLDGYRKKRAKDAGDMTDDEIRQCIYNQFTDFEYREWIA